MCDMIYSTPPDCLNMSIGEAVFSQRAIRRFDHQKYISNEHIEVILNAAAKAPNGGNAQPCRFLVVHDRALIQAFGRLYYTAWWAKRRDDFGWNGPGDMPKDSFYQWPALLAEEMCKVPLVILAFAPRDLLAASSVFPGVQNLMLAARALGIGSVLTTLHVDVMDQVYALFKVPLDMRFYCSIPLGYPRGKFGPTKRYPISKTTYWDQWDIKPPW